jgi:hypothetical protein
MGIIGKPLFYNQRVGIDDVIRDRRNNIARAVDSIPDSRFDAMNDDEAVAAAVHELELDPLKVDFENPTKNVRETKIAYRDEFGMGGSGQADGLEVTKSFPFEGDSNLFSIGTGSWSTSMPYGEVNRGSLVVGMTVRTSDGDAAKNHIDKAVEQIQGYLKSQSDQINAFHEALPGEVRPLVERRRARRGTASDLLSRL